MCGGHGQEGGDPQGDPGRDCLVVNPEGEPRDEDDHGGWHVDCEDEEGQLPWLKNIHKLFLEISSDEMKKGGHLPSKDEVDLQAAVLT